MPAALRDADIAGAVVIITRRESVLFQKGYGYADVAAQLPMDPDQTVIGVGSVSKTFTWTAVMQQVEQGNLDLDRDINAYIDFEIPEAFGKPITLRHLMTHTSGIRDKGFKEVPPDRQPRNLREFLTSVTPPPRVYPPGEVWSYSNYGSMLGGYIVERVSGESFVEYIDNHILKPLDMNHSTFRRPVPDALAGQFSQAYGLGSGLPLPRDREEPSGDPSGHLSTTAADMSRFMRVHLNDGEFDEHRLLKPATVAAMQRRAYAPFAGGYGSTLGFFHTVLEGKVILAHPGDLTGFHADLRLLPNDGIGLFVGLNSDGAPVGLVDKSYTLRTVLFDEFLERFFPAEPDAPEVAVPSGREHAVLAAGEYEMSRQGEAYNFYDAIYLLYRVFLKSNDDGTIETPAMISFTKSVPRTWREVSPFQWREVDGDGRIYMKVVDGRVVSWLPDDLFSFEMLRVPFYRSATLNLPLLYFSVGILALTVLVWPFAAWVRRRSGAVLALTSRERWLRNLSLGAALLGLVYWFAWVAIFIAGVPEQLGQEVWVRLVQSLGVVCIAGAIISLWHAALTCTVSRGVLAQTGAILIALALLALVWFSIVFHLITIQLNF